MPKFVRGAIERASELAPVTRGIADIFSDGIYTRQEQQADTVLGASLAMTNARNFGQLLLKGDKRGALVAAGIGVIWGGLATRNTVFPVPEDRPRHFNFGPEAKAQTFTALSVLTLAQRYVNKRI